MLNLLKLVTPVLVVAALVAGCTSRTKQTASEVLEPSAAAFRIPDAEMSAMQARARGGDCDAALRIGRHHSYYTQDWPQAVIWFRVAARCPSASVKGEFVNILLSTETDDSLVAAEVDDVLKEIEALDPKYYADVFQPVLDSHGYHRKDKPK